MSQHNRLADWVIRRAARVAPAALSERLQEEWRADLMTRSSSLSQLRFVLGCCWAIVWIARERGFATAAAPAAASATGNIAILRDEPSLLSGRSSSLLLVILLHAVVFYALFISLGPTLIKTISPPPALVPTIEPPRPKDPVKVSTSDTKLQPTVLTMPPPDVIIPMTPTDDMPMVEPTTDIPALPPTSSEGPPLHVVNRLQGGPGAGFPSTNDFYPSMSIRAAEQGNVTVQVCVDPRGRLTSDPTTVQSSGSSRLDAGALVLAKAGSGHYRATTEDGHAMSACYPFRVVFTLKK
jgi:periplasmic protein TonB